MTRSPLVNANNTRQPARITMVKTTRPLMSHEAHGTVAGTITHGKLRRTTYAKKKGTPKPTNTDKQRASRAMLRFLSTYWKEISEPRQETWWTLAEENKTTGYHAFLSHNLTRWAHQSLPGIVYPVDEDDTPATLAAAMAFDKIHGINIATLTANAQDNWTDVFHRSTVSGFTPSRKTLVHLEPRLISGAQYWLDSPLLSGTYYYRIGTGSLHGVAGSLLAEISGTALST